VIHTTKTSSLAVLLALGLGACGGSEDKDKKADGKDAKTVAKADDAKADDAKADDAKADDAKADDAKADDAGKGDAAGAAGRDELVGYVPDGANILASTDFKSLFASGLGQYYKVALSQLEGDSKEFMNAAVECKVGPDSWSAAAMGFDTNNQESVVVAFQAGGIGKKETLECLAEKAKAAGAEQKWTMGETNGKPSVEIGEGDNKGKVMSVNDDVVVLAGGTFIDSTAKLLAGEGSAAAEGSLKEPLAGVDRSKTIYFVGMAPPELAQGPMAGLSHGSATVEVSSGLAIGVRMDFADADKAKAAADQINQQVNQFKPMAASMVPQPVIDSLKIEAKDKTITGSVKATEEELKQIQEKVGQAMGGMPGGPGGAPPTGAVPPQAPPQ
jgi:hypothetical protein